MINAPPLQDEFTVARDKVAYEAAQQDRQVLTGTVSADDVSVRMVNAVSAQHRENDIKKKQEQSAKDLLVTLEQIRQQFEKLEAQMIDKYGEDFAEQFAAELLDEETYKKIMEIEDQEERRQAIAEAILKGIEDGTIDPEEVFKNPDFKQWLEANAKIIEARAAIENNGQSLKDNTINHDNEQRANLEQGFDSIFANNGP